MLLLFVRYRLIPNLISRFILYQDVCLNEFTAE
nr:MAG TPA: hypothetical protein [Caudoviricetes sp.]